MFLFEYRLYLPIIVVCFKELLVKKFSITCHIYQDILVFDRRIASFSRWSFCFLKAIYLWFYLFCKPGNLFWEVPAKLDFGIIFLPIWYQYISVFAFMQHTNRCLTFLVFNRPLISGRSLFGIARGVFPNYSSLTRLLFARFVLTNDTDFTLIQRFSFNI